MKTFIILLLLSIGCFLPAVEEIESNDTYHEATYAKGASKLTGTLAIDRSDRDFFLLDPFLAVNSHLRLEARIVSGPNAGSENFSLTVHHDAAHGLQSFADRTYQGYLLYDPGYGEFLGLPLIVEVSGTGGGQYEVDVRIRPVDHDKPKIKFTGRRTNKGSGQSTLGVKVNDGFSYIKKLVVRTQGNPHGKIVTKGARARVTNLSGKFSNEIQSGYDLVYEFRRIRPNMRVHVLVEDAAGKKTVRSTRFR